jgi:hypothetical protein
MPVTKYFWKEMNTINIGIRLKADKAKTYPHWVN